MVFLVAKVSKSKSKEIPGQITIFPKKTLLRWLVIWLVNIPYTPILQDCSMNAYHESHTQPSYFFLNGIGTKVEETRESPWTLERPLQLRKSPVVISTSIRLRKLDAWKKTTPKGYSPPQLMVSEWFTTLESPLKKSPNKKKTHPSTARKINGWNLRIHPWRRKFIFQNHHCQVQAINLRGCISQPIK